MYQKVFKSAFIENSIEKLHSGKIEGNFPQKDFKFRIEDILLNKKIEVEENFPDLHADVEGKYDFDNARKLFEYFKNITPTQASDSRLWTYLALVECSKYLKVRWSLKGTEEKQKQSILTHWYIPYLSARTLSRHGLSWLWWGAYSTYDKDRTDPYELTQEFFERKDLIRTTLEETLGRNRNFLHALLEFFIENEKLFANYKQEKTRFIIRRSNLLAGYKLFGALPKNEIKRIFSQYIKQIDRVSKSNPEGLK